MDFYRQQGVGFLEVLVSLLVLSISLLAIAGLQSRALHYNHSAYVRSQMNILAYDMLDRIRANRINANSYRFNYNDSLAALNSTCTGSLVEKDTCEWQQHLQKILPHAKAKLACEPLNSEHLYKCDIAIFWQENNLFDAVINDAQNTEAHSTFSYSTSI